MGDSRHRPVLLGHVSNIFALAIEGLGPLKSQASSLLVLAILGGGVASCSGAVADVLGIQFSFVVPVFAFAYIAFYGFYGYRAGRTLTRRRPGHDWPGLDADTNTRQT